MSISPATMLLMNFNLVLAADLGSYDPSRQLNRDREEMERQRIWEQITENEENRKAKIEDERTTSEAIDSDITFELTEIIFNESEILTREELEATVAEFIGKAVSVKDLYTITERVNKLYEDKGFIQSNSRHAIEIGFEGGRKSRHDRLRADSLRAVESIVDVIRGQQRL